MKTSLISFSCDGPGCEATVMAEHEFDPGPEDWFRVSPPGTIEWEDAEASDFCSLRCLHGWVRERVGARS